MTWPIVQAYVLLLAAILATLFPTIRAVKAVDPETAPVEEMRPVTRATVLVHHQGLLLGVTMIALFGVLLLGRIA